jgi:ribosome-associated protein
MTRITFKIDGDYIELIRLLKTTGLCATGGMAKNAVAEGLVEVDHVRELRKRCKIRRGQQVEFAGNLIDIE